MKMKYPLALKTPTGHRIIPHEWQPWWECVECGTQAAYEPFMNPDSRMNDCDKDHIELLDKLGGKS